MSTSVSNVIWASKSDRKRPFGIEPINEDDEEFEPEKLHVLRDSPYIIYIEEGSRDPYNYNLENNFKPDI